MFITILHHHPLSALLYDINSPKYFPDLVNISAGQGRPGGGGQPRLLLSRPDLSAGGGTAESSQIAGVGICKKKKKKIPNTNRTTRCSERR